MLSDQAHGQISIVREIRPSMAMDSEQGEGRRPSMAIDSEQGDGRRPSMTMDYEQGDGFSSLQLSFASLNTDGGRSPAHRANEGTYRVLKALDLNIPPDCSDPSTELPRYDAVDIEPTPNLDSSDCAPPNPGGSDLILNGGWKRRGKHGPECRRAPSKMSAIEQRLYQFKDRKGAEIFEPTVGTTFDSSQEAYEFYNLYSWECGFGIRHGKSRTNTNNYRSMHELVCQCADKARKENASSCKTDCKAMIKLLRTKDHGWYVSAFVKEHNHRLSLGYDAKMQWNSHNHIDAISQDFIKNLRENNISITKVYNILGGLGAGPQAVPYRKQLLRTLCSRYSQETIKDDLSKTMSLLQEMKAQDNNLKVEVDVDAEGRVRSMLWCTGKNRQDYVHFGDVVTFDTTYKTNLYNMPFGLFVGVNNHFQSVIFGGVLMREETEVAFKWVFSTFVTIMDNKQPVTILTDQAQAMKGAIESALPEARHRWCKWHVLRDAKEKIGHVYNKFSGFKKQFHPLINDIMCVEEFEDRWSKLVEKYKLNNNDYMTRLFDKRAMWAKPYFKEIFCAGMTSTQRSESANHMLKQYIQRSSPMHVFVRQYGKFLGARRSEEAREAHMTANRSCSFESSYPIEDDAASIYTRAVFSKFQDELHKSGSYVVTVVEPGSHYIVSVAPSKVVDESRRKQRTVKIEESGQFISCDCGMFDHVGMLCRHSIKVLVRDDILKIPAKNIMKRWTIWACGEFPKGMDMIDNASSPHDNSYLKNLLRIAVEDLVRESCDKPSLEHALEGVTKLTSVVRKKRRISSEPPQSLINSIQCPVNITSSVLLPPEGLNPNGRPATVRPKSRMDYVAVKTRKKKKKETSRGNGKTPVGTPKNKKRPVASLYDNQVPSLSPEVSAGETVTPDVGRPKRKIHCQSCKLPGHTRLTCTQRGISKNLFECR
nr:protein FAR1-RELATED SEQUENCE 5 isoform X2 [Aegilops tauschii subsp. strangulata]